MGRASLSEEDSALLDTQKVVAVLEEFGKNATSSVISLSFFFFSYITI